MEREKLLKYRGLAPIRFLNDFNAGLLTAEEYKLIRKVGKNDAWDELDSYIEHAEEFTQHSAEREEANEEATPPVEPVRRTELRTEVRIERNFFAVPNDVIDVLAPLQTPVEEVVYRRLFRMSFGWQRNYCRASIPYLLKTSDVQSRNTMRKALRGLIEKGHIAEYIDERGRVDINNEGTLYIVFLPNEIDGLPPARSKNKPGAIIKGGLRINPGQNLTPQAKGVQKNLLTPKGSIFNRSNIKGGSNIKGVKIDPHDGQKLKGHNLTLPTESLVNTNTTAWGSKIEGVKIDPIKNNNTNSLKNTLSSDPVISFFYKGIGQARISKTKRERARETFKELQKDGFNSEAIQFAVEWTLKNTKEELYDFSIIKYTIGQAMAAKEKMEAATARKLQKEKIAVQKQADNKKREKEKAKIDSYKEALSFKEREKLREKAEAEIKESGQYKAEFITEHLIKAKENELVRNQIGV